MDINTVEQYVLILLEDSNDKVKMKDMAELVGTDTRTIRKAINRLTKAGHLISNIGGYSIIRTQQELDLVILRQKKRALASLKRYQALKKQALITQERVELQ